MLTPKVRLQSVVMLAPQNASQPLCVAVVLPARSRALQLVTATVLSQTSP